MRLEYILPGEVISCNRVKHSMSASLFRDFRATRSKRDWLLAQAHIESLWQAMQGKALHQGAKAVARNWRRDEEAKAPAQRTKTE